MAKRHPADSELTDALSALAEIDAAVARWVPDNGDASVEVVPIDVGHAKDAENVDGHEPSDTLNADVSAVVTAVDAAGGSRSALVRVVLRFDEDIDTIIAQANDMEAPTFREKILRRIRLGRMPSDMLRRDGILASRLVVSLERASRLTASLEAHRLLMRKNLSLIEADLIKRIDSAKSIDDGGAEAIRAAEEMSFQQDVIEALIRHEAVCNSIYHKLSIEVERGLVVLHALAGGQGVTLGDQLSADARDTLSPLLGLSDKGMLSMREVERRKLAVDDNFQHRLQPNGNMAAARQTFPAIKAHV